MQGVNDEPVRDLAGELAHPGADAGKVDGNLPIDGGRRAEERRHQGDLVVRPAMADGLAGPPPVPDGTHRRDVLLAIAAESPRRERHTLGDPQPHPFREVLALDADGVADDLVAVPPSPAPPPRATARPPAGGARGDPGPEPWYRLPIFSLSNTSEIRGPAIQPLVS